MCVPLNQIVITVSQSPGIKVLRFRTQSKGNVTVHSTDRDPAEHSVSELSPTLYMKRR